MNQLLELLENRLDSMAEKLKEFGQEMENKKDELRQYADMVKKFDELLKQCQDVEINIGEALQEAERRLKGDNKPHQKVEGTAIIKEEKEVFKAVRELGGKKIRYSLI